MPTEGKETPERGLCPIFCETTQIERWWYAGIKNARYGTDKKAGSGLLQKRR
ncbi:MAG: hypothetical protein IJQ81_12055 [Oscillibacter sp.]|nr:hypothetical protein [Oscillibacter sp.]